MQKILVVCFVLLVAVFSAQAQDTLIVDASQDLGAINPFIYGSNMNLYTIVPGSLMTDAQKMGLKLMRFGGGDADRQDLRNSIIDLFVLQSRALGAEPLLSVRLLDGTTEHAAEVVQYTLDKGYNIRYWSIGNEPNLFQALMGVESYTSEELNSQWRTIADAMLEVDPSIQFVGPDITQYMPLEVNGDSITYHPLGSALDPNGKDWLVEFLKANGDLLSMVAIHRYPFPGAGNAGATIEGLQAINNEWEVVIPNIRTIIKQYAGRDIPLAITEINSNSANSVGGEASLDSFYNAIWLGDVLGRLINLKVEAVNYWDVQGSAGRGWGLIGSYDVRPTSYTYVMYTYFGTNLVSATSPSETVRVYAATREDGTLTLMLINMTDEETMLPLSLQGFNVGSDAQGWQLTADNNAEAIPDMAIDDGTMLTLPAQSMTVWAIPSGS